MNKLENVVRLHIADLKRCVPTLVEYNLNDTAKEVESAVKELEQALEQPIQEPIYFVNGDIGWEQVSKERYDKERHDDDKWKLYTHPKEWQGLSDEEVIAMSDDAYEMVDLIKGKALVFDRYKYAKAIEQKLKEKNT